MEVGILVLVTHGHGGAALIIYYLPSSIPSRARCCGRLGRWGSARAKIHSGGAAVRRSRDSTCLGPTAHRTWTSPLFSSTGWISCQASRYHPWRLRRINVVVRRRRISAKRDSIKGVDKKTGKSCGGGGGDVVLDGVEDDAENGAMDCSRRITYALEQRVGAENFVNKSEWGMARIWVHMCAKKGQRIALGDNIEWKCWRKLRSQESQTFTSHGIGNHRVHFRKHFLWIAHDFDVKLWFIIIVSFALGAVAMLSSKFVPHFYCCKASVLRSICPWIKSAWEFFCQVFKTFIKVLEILA